jgi:hypothetical protein
MSGRNVRSHHRQGRSPAADSILDQGDVFQLVDGEIVFDRARVWRVRLKRDNTSISADSLCCDYRVEANSCPDVVDRHPFREEVIQFLLYERLCCP